MVELNTWAGLEPAVMDIKTVSGLAQVFELTLTDSAGSVVDLEGVTFRGAVNTAPLRELMCSVEGGKVLFGWSGLPAGRHSFDLFLVTGQVEKALVRGAFVVSGRVIPPLDQESYSVNHAATLVLPDTTDGIILVDLSEVGLVDLLSRKAGAFAEEARDHVSSVRELKEFIVQKVDGFGYVVDTATTAITEAGKSAVASVESGREEAVQAVKKAGETATTAITEAGKSAVASVESGREEAVQAVKKAGETATTAITEAGKSAVASVESGREEAVQAVKKAKETATAAITEAEKSAVASVESTRRAAVGTITPLVQDVETAKDNIDQVERRINTAATNATTAATSAANSATAAQQALEAMPQVDAAGNMTLAGNITAAEGTFDAVVNANGGINIPLAVGAPTDTAAVNRLHAAGMAGVTDIFSQHAYLNTGSITATGTAATTVLIPGQYAQVRVPAGTHSTIVFPFTGPNGQHNYSNFAGFSIPWRIIGAGKITIGIGRGSKTTRSDLTQGSYSIIPGNNLAHNSGEILDITFDNVRDATRGGYVVKVREIYALSKAAGWRVKTTTSFVPATHNEPIPSIVNKIIYHQRTQYKFESEYISYGSLYLLTGGGQTVQLHKIAAVRGVNAFETGLGISSIVTDLPGNASGDVYMQVGSAVRTLYQPGNINPVYYALEALARNDIEAEETADFVDINIPL